MERLPPEIAHLVLKELCGDNDPDDVSELPTAELKALRLSCNFFADLASSYLFRCVWLYIEGDSFARLTALSQHPSLRHAVCSIKIFSKVLSADLLVKEDYEECVKAIKFSGDGGGKWGFDADGDRSLSQEQLDTGYTEYSNIYNGHVDLSNNAEIPLQAALTAFTNLTSISTGSAYEFMQDDGWLTRLSKFTTFARRTLLVGKCKGWKSLCYDAHDALLIIRAIAMSECDGICLDLGDDDGPYDCLFLDCSPQNRVFARATLQKLTELHLNLYSPNFQELKDILEAGCCTRFLQWAWNLKVLEIDDRVSKDDMSSGYDNPLAHVFGTQTWPSLQELTLVGFHVRCGGAHRLDKPAARNTPGIAA